VKIALSDGVTFRSNHVHDNVGPGRWCDINCHNVVYEDNLVERNQGAGIFYWISFTATIRDNVVRHNGTPSVAADAGSFSLIRAVRSRMAEVQDT
jgi:hypothetical protein